jgi:hypothetical protein
MTNGSQATWEELWDAIVMLIKIVLIGIGWLLILFMPLGFVSERHQMATLVVTTILTPIVTFLLFMFVALYRRGKQKRDTGDSGTFSILRKDLLLTESVSINLISLEYTIIKCILDALGIAGIQLCLVFYVAASSGNANYALPFHWAWWLILPPLSFFLQLQSRISFETRASGIRYRAAATSFFIANKYGIRIGDD